EWGVGNRERQKASLRRRPFLSFPTPYSLFPTPFPLEGIYEHWNGRHHLRSHQRLRGRAHQPGEPTRHPVVVVRRGQEARDHQLPHLPARERRAVLREDLRSRERLGVLLREVPRHEAQGDDL